MTFWKVDYRTPDRKFDPLHVGSETAAMQQVFCDGIPSGFYDTNYYCREVNLPDNVLAAAERLLAGFNANASQRFHQFRLPLLADRSGSYRLAS